MAEGQQVARKRRHQEHMKLKRRADRQREAEQNQTFEARSCHCATLCSATKTDFCKLYEAVPFPVTTDPLKPWESSIRLIRLKAGGEGDTIECDLFHASLDGSHQFIALSYVWGDYDDRITICVNGRAVNITRHLHTALVHLRNRSSDTTLWVDAICIDQGNLCERNSQVQHMPKVYSVAAEVIAWLGEEADGSGQVIDYINSHAKGASGVSRQHEPPPAAQLEYLWSRPYWGRVWVVQELASAYRSNGRCYMRCGHRSVSFEQFRYFLGEYLANHIYTQGDSVLGPKHLTNLSIAHGEKSFLEILSESAFLASTDPRDRIYGIRGISPEFYRSKIPVDYQISFHELCRRVIFEYIKKEKNLDILCQFKGFPRNDHCPSWVRDLSSYNRGVSLTIHSASAGSQPNPTISDNILHINGRLIGRANLLRGPYKFPTALQTGQPWPEMPNLRKVEAFALAALSKRHNNSTPGDLQGRFMNLVSGDRWRGAAIHGTKVPHPPREVWDAVNQCKNSSQVDEQTHMRYKYFPFLFSPLIGRTLFDTVGGSVGVGPPNMQKDDIICVLHGCSYCAVLRKVKKQHYTFIGPAYVDGAMSGEYIRQEYDDEGRPNLEVQFHIH
ncbi:hypothetical protein JX266_009834 [Neoarthrinium moseri]|nr:hypothetical protein JX266_009834 [Neoarthrinium moseri]